MRIPLTIAALGAALLGFIPASSAQDAPAPAAEQSAPAPLDPTILAASATSPEAFLRVLLAIYAKGDTPPDQLPDNQAFFSASTLALIEAINVKNDGPAFDADPFCDCQDWSTLTVASVATTPIDDSHASLVVTLAGDSKLAQTYLLVKEAGGWRVDDVVHPEYGSLVERLKKQ